MADTLSVFSICFAAMSYKLLFWSDRDVSLSAVVLLAACAFAVTTLLLGASATLDIEPRDISPQAVILAVKQALKTAVVNIVRTFTA